MSVVFTSKKEKCNNLGLRKILERSVGRIIRMQLESVTNTFLEGSTYTRDNIIHARPLRGTQNSILAHFLNGGLQANGLHKLMGAS